MHLLNLHYLIFNDFSQELLQPSWHSHDVFGELNQFNQLREEPMLSSEEEDAPIDELDVTLDVLDLHPPVTQRSQVNDEVVERSRSNKIRNYRGRD